MKIQNDTFNIRISGDGTSIAHNLKILNFTFSFLDKVDQSIYTLLKLEIKLQESPLLMLTL